MTMTELIKISDQVFGSDRITVQTVSARDLHAFLEVRKDFSTWVKARIEQYGFVEHNDFVTAQNLRSPVLGSAKARAQIAIDYYLSIDMAKELAMVERNDKGKQARQYFLECERRAKQVATTGGFSIPKTMHEALRLAADLSEAKDKAEEQLALAAPKIEFHDTVAEAINCQPIQEVAKVMNMGPNKLFSRLREEGILMPNNLPYQRYIDDGYFRVIENKFKDKNKEAHIYSRTLVTGKGLIYIQRKMAGGQNSLSLH